MKRQFVAGVMGLAVAGCAHFRSDAPKGSPATNPVGPVGINPVPSIYDTVNRGTGNAAMAQSALGDPNDPHWAGQAPAPDPGRPGAADAPTPSQSPQSPRMAAAGPTGAPPRQWAGPANQPAGLPDQAAGSDLAAASPSGASARQWAGPTAQPAPAPQPGGLPDQTVTMPAGDLAATAAAAALPAGSTMGGDPAAMGGQPAQGVMSPQPSMAAGPGAGPARDDVAGAGGASPASTIPSTLDRPGGPMPGMVAGPGGLPGPAAGLPPAGPRGDASPGGPMPGGPPQSEPNGPSVAGPGVNDLSPVGEPPASIAGMTSAPSDPAVNPSAGRTGQAPAARAARPQPAGDPLLGPNPDLMPDLPPLPANPPAATSAAAKQAAPTAVPAAPAGTSPPAGPATGPDDGPPALAPSGAASAPPSGPPPSSPPDLGPPSADNRPGGAGPAAGADQLVDLPPLEPGAAAGPAPGAFVQHTVASANSSVPVRRVTSRRDGQVQRTSFQTTAEGPQPGGDPRARRGDSILVAQVGDDVITLNDLKALVREHFKARNIDTTGIPQSELIQIYKSALWEMVDQLLLIQEARRVLHDPKHYDQFLQELDKYWKEVELDQLEKQFAVEDERHLREKFKERGRSLDVHYKSFRQSWMAENFLHAKLKNKVKVDYPELLKYYNDHIHDKEFDRPATILWHEIIVEARRYPDRADARKKADAILAQLRRGADFARLAGAQSDGPTLSRDQGGLMETSPGTYGVAAVNAALETLPIGQVSGILEGPESYHIVRVDRRRAAGPAPFEDLQDQIRSTLLNRKFQAARAAYLEKLRRETPAVTFINDLKREPRDGRS